MGWATPLSYKSQSLSLPPSWDMGILVLTVVNKIRKGKAIFFLIM